MLWYTHVHNLLHVPSQRHKNNDCLNYVHTCTTYSRYVLHVYPRSMFLRARIGDALECHSMGSSVKFGSQRYRIA